MRKSYGYTTIEVIIILVIAMVLVGLVLSAIDSARKSASRKYCLSNVKNLSIALQLYATDNDDVYPSAVASMFVHEEDQLSTISHGHGFSWSNLIAPYMTHANTGAFHCPSISIQYIMSSKDYSTFSGYSYADQLKFSGYAYNYSLSESSYIDEKRDVLSGKSLSTVGYSSLTVSFAEARSGVTALYRSDIIVKGRILGIYIPQFATSIKKQPSGAVRHQGGANYAFADGHVKWFKPQQLSTASKCDGMTPGFGL